MQPHNQTGRDKDWSATGAILGEGRSCFAARRAAAVAAGTHLSLFSLAHLGGFAAREYIHIPFFETKKYWANLLVQIIILRMELLKNCVL